MEDRLRCNSNHRLNLTFKSTIDSAQNITFRPNLVLNDAFFPSISNSETRNTENALQNDGSRNYQNDGTIDSLFRRKLHPINVNDDLTTNGYFNFVRPIRRIKSNLNLTLNTTWNRGILYINDEKNKTDRWVSYAQISLDNRKKKQFDGNIGVRFIQNSTTYSASSAFNQSFINQRYFVDLSIFPNKNWAVNSGLDYQVFPRKPSALPNKFRSEKQVSPGTYSKTGKGKSNSLLMTC